MTLNKMGRFDQVQLKLTMMLFNFHFKAPPSVLPETHSLPPFLLSLSPFLSLFLNLSNVHSSMLLSFYTVFSFPLFSLKSQVVSSQALGWLTVNIDPQLHVNKEQTPNPACHLDSLFLSLTHTH